MINATKKNQVKDIGNARSGDTFLGRVITKMTYLGNALDHHFTHTHTRSCAVWYEKSHKPSFP